MLSSRASWVVVPLALGVLIGCPPPAEINTEYEEENVTVVGSGSGGEAVESSAPLAPGECVDVGEACVTPEEAVAGSEWCQGADEGGPMDVIVVDGEVVEVICYPPPKDDAPIELVDDGTGDVEVPQTASGTVVSFDHSLDGEPIEGNLNIEGNNVAIFGNGAEDTIIDGNIILSGNNVRLRGVTVTGNVYADQNNVAISFCRILGNLVLEGESTNNSVIVANEIHVNLGSSSNNHLVVANRVQGEVSLTGNNYTCEDNRAFSDENDDDFVQESELGDEIACD